MIPRWYRAHLVSFWRRLRRCASDAFGVGASLTGLLGFVLSLVPGLVSENGQSLFGRSEAEGRDVEVG